MNVIHAPITSANQKNTQRRSTVGRQLIQKPQLINDRFLVAQFSIALHPNEQREIINIVHASVRLDLF